MNNTQTIPAPAIRPRLGARARAALANTLNGQGVRDGFVKTIPAALGVAAYGLVFGMLAGQAGLTYLEAGGMSALVYAASAQFVALDMWQHPLPLMAIIATTFAINIRHVLMGAALPAWYRKQSPILKYVSVFFMVDEAWAVSMTEYNKGSKQGAFLLGAGLCVFPAWVLPTIAGMAAGNLIPDPSRFGLDFAFTAVFLGLLACLYRNSSDLPPWLAAAATATACSLAMPGKWYIIIGGLAGAAVGGLNHARKR